MKADNFLNKVIIFIISLVVLLTIYYIYDYLVRVKPQSERIKKYETMEGDLTKAKGAGDAQIAKIDQVIQAEETRLQQLKAEKTAMENTLGIKQAEQTADEAKLQSKEQELAAAIKTQAELEAKKKQGGLSLEDEAFIEKQIAELDNQMDGLIEEIDAIRTRIGKRTGDVNILHAEIADLEGRIKDKEEKINDLKTKRQQIEAVADEIRQTLMLVAGAKEKERKEQEKYLHQGVIERCLNIFATWGEGYKRLPRDLVEENLNTGYVDNFAAKHLPSSFQIQDGQLKHENKILGTVACQESVDVLKQKLDRALADSDRLIKNIESLNNEDAQAGLSEFGIINKKYDLKHQINDIKLREIPHANLDIEGNQTKIGRRDANKQKKLAKKDRLTKKEDKKSDEDK